MNIDPKVVEAICNDRKKLRELRQENDSEIAKQNDNVKLVFPDSLLYAVLKEIKSGKHVSISYEHGKDKYVLVGYLNNPECKNLVIINECCCARVLFKDESSKVLFCAITKFDKKIGKNHSHFNIKAKIDWELNGLFNAINSMSFTFIHWNHIINLPIVAEGNDLSLYIFMDYKNNTKYCIVDKDANWERD